MKELLDYILKGVTGNDNFNIESKEEGETTTFTVSVDSEQMGLVIGKGGNTIKAIQTLARIRGGLEGKSVFVNVVESSN